ncbi:MAG: hypothetical protein H7196_03795 [candidate division SR1 bacterium]|nr:hypothetical protein [candidate division SR1 bacterium]
MSNFTSRLSDSFTDSVADLGRSFGNFLPNLIISLLLLIIGLLVANVAAEITRRLLHMFGFNRLTQSNGIKKLVDMIGGKGTVFDNIIPSIIYWIILLIFIVAIANTLQLGAVTTAINTIIAYIPNIIAAVIIFILSVAAANFVGETVRIASTNLGAQKFSKYLDFVAQALIIILGSIIALNQIGFNVSIIATNLTAIIIGIVATLTISTGFGSIGIMQNVITGLVLSQYYKKGQTVNVSGIAGKISSITLLGVILEGGEQKFLPYSAFTQSGQKPMTNII